LASLLKILSGITRKWAFHDYGKNPNRKENGNLSVRNQKSQRQMMRGRRPLGGGQAE
jgi:hypothetical protein